MKKKILHSKDEDLINIYPLSPKIFPIEEAKGKFKNYFDKLRSAIKHKSVKNIAITGSYGSGKTTILRNYQNVYDSSEAGSRYLNISLATFSEESTSNKNSPKENLNDLEKDSSDDISNNLAKEALKNGQKVERLIELSIIQQILYHVEASKVPNSNLKRIKKSFSKNFLIGFMSLSIVWIYTTILLFKFDHLSKINPNNWGVNKSFEIITFFLVIVFTTGLGYIIYNGLKLLNNTKINKLKFLENELELGENINKSILNEHLDEIVYFFQQTDFDVVIFEDIDRFENTEIFTKLREINLLLNESKQIERELGKIVFVYAIRDDKFKDGDRTKFFDYILPIIPFISPSNASEQLLTLIEQENLSETFTKNFIDDVVTFIDDIDMRLLINIFNEFLIYKSKILINDNNRKRNDNLLGIIIYKNLHPKDFAELPHRKGDMFTIINQKKVYVRKKIEGIQQEIILLETELKDIESENNTYLKELRAVYVNNIIGKVPDALAIIINEEVYEFRDLLEEDAFEKLKSLNNIILRYYNGYYGENSFNYRSTESHISFEDIEQEVNPNLNYDSRSELVEKKSKSRINEIKRQRDLLKTKQIEVESWELQQIFQELNITPDTSAFNNSKLIRYLLLEGYINENYSHYISLFHEVNLTKRDFEFERNVKSGEISSFDFKLENIKNLINKIDIKYFGRPAILNFNLLNYLLENNNKEEDKLDNFFKQLSKPNKRTIDFIDSFINYDKLNDVLNTQEEDIKEPLNIELFVKLLCNSWDGFWDYIVLESSYSDKKIEKYAKYIIQYADIDDLTLGVDDNSIDMYVAQKNDFLRWFDIKFHKKVKVFISKANLKLIELIQPETRSKDLFDFVYKHHNYELNLNNISEILNQFHKNPKVSGKMGTFSSNNYEVILESGCDNLINYIDKNIDEYVLYSYLETGVEIEEEESILINYFYNNESLSLTLKAKIIPNTKTRISQLNKVVDLELKKLLIESNKVDVTWNNIHSYLSDLDEGVYIDTSLINFYNREENSEALSKQTLGTDDKGLEIFYKEIRLAVLECEEISIENYSNLILSINKVYNELSFEHLSEDKVQLLIEKGKLSLSETNYQTLRLEFPKLHLLLLENHQNDFIKDITPYSLNEEELEFLFNSDKLSNSNLSRLLEGVSIENFSCSRSLSEAVLKFVLKNKSTMLSFDSITEIFNHDISNELKIKLILFYSKSLSKEKIINLIKKLSGNYSKIVTKTQTIIPKNKNNNKLLNMLKEKGIISHKSKENFFNNDEYRIYRMKL